MITLPGCLCCRDNGAVQLYAGLALATILCMWVVYNMVMYVWRIKTSAQWLVLNIDLFYYFGWPDFYLGVTLGLVQVFLLCLFLIDAFTLLLSCMGCCARAAFHQGDQDATDTHKTPVYGKNAGTTADDDDGDYDLSDDEKDGDPKHI